MVPFACDRFEVSAEPFSSTQRPPAQQVEKGRSWLEPLAGEVAGRNMAVTARQLDGPASRPTVTASGKLEKGSDGMSPDSSDW